MTGAQLRAACSPSHLIYSGLDKVLFGCLCDDGSKMLEDLLLQATILPARQEATVHAWLRSQQEGAPPGWVRRSPDLHAWSDAE